MSEDRINAVQAEWVEADMPAIDFADELSDEALDREHEGRGGFPSRGTA